MTVTEPIEWRLRRGQYLGDISALCFLHLPSHVSSIPLLLAGTGSQILVYELANGNLVRSFQVFEGIRVHGISLDPFYKQLEGTVVTFQIAVYGERRVKMFVFRIEVDGERQSFLNMELNVVHSMPKFGHWVLDVCFLKDFAASNEDARYLAVGCSDNAVYFWDILRRTVFSEVKSSEKCLLYCMRMLGNAIEGLCIASGTISNEIVVWKVVQEKHPMVPGSRVRNQVYETDDDNVLLYSPKYKDVHMSKLIGHEGSIFSIAWFPNGLKLVSVSDDRSARIWEVLPEKVASLHGEVDHLIGPVLFGHNARIWDCSIFDSLIITAGEDCTCRVWDHDGRELKEIKEHIGRGVWRCLYDPSSSLLVTAGFDSAIKVHHLFPSSEGVEGILASGNSDRKEVFSLSIPNNSSVYGGLMDSKSEYVRCLQFSREDSLYVATNHGYLYHVCLDTDGTVKWTELVCISNRAPIICMDILSTHSSCSGKFEDCVAIGDGKGSMTIVQVGIAEDPEVEFTLTWSAEKERHLLGAYWCKSAGNRFIFTADPGGRLKLWKLCHNLPSLPLLNGETQVSLIAEFISCFGMRIMCVSASFDEELLVCGDIRGNLLLYSLPRSLLCRTSVAAEVEASAPLNYFKGAHGVSSVCSVSILGLSSDQVEIHSTGTDGCICSLQHDRDHLNLEFIGMKQVKELSAVRSVFLSTNNSSGSYAVGFSSDNFIIWNLTSETKVTEITCGGWRRPHSYHLGDLPEIMNCFCFVKNDVIYVHRHWVPENNLQIYPRNLHFQFHGREIHSLCFISGYPSSNSDESHGLVSRPSFLATGCEDGTVRLTRYGPGIENWSSSKLLGEHVGGSAVRSLCFVSKMHIFTPDSIVMPDDANKQNGSFEDKIDPSIIISVGAKRVVTAWKQIPRMNNKRMGDDHSENNITVSPGETFPSLSFQWLSTDMPSKHKNIVNRKNTLETSLNLKTTPSDTVSVDPHSSDGNKIESNSDLEDSYENDWRYLDITAFLVKHDGTRISVCFILVACSDATVILRALVLPFRLWFDVASLAPLTSPVLALKHVVIPLSPPSKGNMLIGNMYLAITGSTDGNITIWNLTECVENFMQEISGLKMENYMEFQKRPRTGRGSQGGRWWRHIDGNYTKKKPVNGISPGHPGAMEKDNNINLISTNSTECDEGKSQSEKMYPPETSILTPLHIISKAHQSGVNCLHVSDIKGVRAPDSRASFYFVSGGDDQAINCFKCSLEYSSIENHQIEFGSVDKLISAHCSAVKGIWTDGEWIFSVGLDQRVRCWRINGDGVRELCHLIASVPEPEALDVKTCGRNCYEIAVAGRGMQMVEFILWG